MEESILSRTVRQKKPTRGHIHGIITRTKETHLGMDRHSHSRWKVFFLLRIPSNKDCSSFLIDIDKLWRRVVDTVLRSDRIDERSFLINFQVLD